MKLRTINQLGKLKGKKILLRVDLNCDVVQGKIIESDRINAHAETIRFLKNKGAKVIVLAHQGSPGKKDCLSLRQHSKLLNKYVKVKYVNETVGKKAWREISSLRLGKVLLLENTRFLKDEFKPSANNDFVNFFKEAGIEIFVQDAFSVLHRNQSSIVSFPKVFPSAIGLVLEEELKNIEKIKSKLKNCLFVLGGNKTKDLLPLLKHNRVLTTGKLSLIALKAKGFHITKSNGLSNEELKLEKKIRKIKKLGVPIDLALIVKNKRKEISIEHLPKKYPVLDLGFRTVEIYKKKILKEKSSVFIKGAAGMFENKQFALGTKEILKAAEKSKAFTVVAGGSMSDAVRKFKINKKKLGYVSLSGGSLVKYLAGDRLVGLEVLK